MNISNLSTGAQSSSHTPSEKPKLPSLSDVQQQRVNKAFEELKNPREEAAIDTTLVTQGPGKVATKVIEFFLDKNFNATERVEKRKEEFKKTLLSIMTSEEADNIMTSFFAITNMGLSQAGDKVFEKSPFLKELMNSDQQYFVKLIQSNILLLANNLLKKKINLAKSNDEKNKAAPNKGEFDALCQKRDIGLILEVLDQPEISQYVNQLLFNTTPITSSTHEDDIKKEGMQLSEGLFNALFKTVLDPEGKVKDDAYLKELDLPINWSKLNDWIGGKTAKIARWGVNLLSKNNDVKDVINELKDEKSIHRFFINKLMIPIDQVIATGYCNRIKMAKEIPNAEGETSEDIKHIGQKISKGIINVFVKGIQTSKTDLARGVLQKLKNPPGLSEEWLVKQIEWFATDPSAAKYRSDAQSLIARTLNFLIKENVKDPKNATMMDVFFSFSEKLIDLMKDFKLETIDLEELGKSFDLRQKTKELEAQIESGNLSANDLEKAKKELDETKNKINKVYQRWLAPRVVNGHQEHGVAVEFVKQFLKKFGPSIEKLGIGNALESDKRVSMYTKLVWDTVVEDLVPRILIDTVADISHPLTIVEENEKEIDDKTQSLDAVLEARMRTKDILSLLRKDEWGSTKKGAIYEMFPKVLENLLDKKIENQEFESKKLKEYFNSPDTNIVWELAESIVNATLLKIFAKSTKEGGVSLEQIKTQGVWLHLLSKFSKPILDTFYNEIQEDDIIIIEQKPYIEAALKKQPDDEDLKKRLEQVNKKALVFVHKVLDIIGLSKDDLPIPHVGELPEKIWDMLIEKTVPDLILSRYSDMIPTIWRSLKNTKLNIEDQEKSLEKAMGSPYGVIFGKTLSHFFVDKFAPDLLSKDICGTDLKDLIARLGLDKILDNMPESDRRALISAADSTGVLSVYVMNIVFPLLTKVIVKLNDKRSKNENFDLKLVISVIEMATKHLQGNNAKPDASAKKEMIKHLRTLLLDLADLKKPDDLKAYLPQSFINEAWDAITSDDEKSGLFPILSKLIDELFNDPSLIPTMLANIIETTNDSLKFNPQTALSELQALKAKKNRKQEDIELIVQKDEQLKRSFRYLADQNVKAAVEINSMIEKIPPLDVWPTAAVKKINAFNQYIQQPSEHKDPEQVKLDKAVQELLKAAIPISGLKDAEKNDFILRHFVKPSKSLEENHALISETIRNNIGKNFLKDMINLLIERGLPQIESIGNGKYTFDPKTGKVTNYVDKLTGGRVRVPNLPGEDYANESYFNAKRKALEKFQGVKAPAMAKAKDEIEQARTKYNVDLYKWIHDEYVKVCKMLKMDDKSIEKEKNKVQVQVDQLPKGKAKFWLRKIEALRTKAEFIHICEEAKMEPNKVQAELKAAEEKIEKLSEEQNLSRSYFWNLEIESKKHHKKDDKQETPKVDLNIADKLRAEYLDVKGALLKKRDDEIKVSRRVAAGIVLAAETEFNKAVNEAEDQRKIDLKAIEATYKNHKMGVSKKAAETATKRLNTALAETPKIAIEAYKTRKWERFKAGAQRALTPVVAKILHFIFVTVIGNILKFLFYPIVLLVRWMINRIAVNKGKKIADAVIPKINNYFNSPLAYKATDVVATAIKD